MSEIELSQEQKKLREELNKIYTPLSVAKKEIQRRWKDKKLRKKVEDFLGGDIPELLNTNIKACFGRHIVTPSFELLYFLKVVANLEMDFGFIEYTKDKFISKNSSKYHICRLFFHDGKSKNHKDRVSGLKITNMIQLDGKSLDSIQTNWGEKLVDFHHRLLNIAIPDIDKKIFDVSFWKKRKGKSLEDFYIYYLALFVRNGILFENFLLNEEESGITKNIVIPAFKKLEKLFGIKPLIVRMLPRNNEEELFWFHYPGFLKPVIKNMIKIRN
jgi:hypothetical protein